MLKCQIIGNLGSDPEFKYGQGGAAHLQFSVASNGRTRGAGGEWQDKTEWVRVTVFGQRAETLSQHLSRGMRVYVDGRLEARPWIDRANEPKAGLEIVADTVEFASSRQDRDVDDPGYSHPTQTVNRGRPMSEATAVQGGRPASRIPTGGRRA